MRSEKSFTVQGKNQLAVMVAPFLSSARDLCNVCMCIIRNTRDMRSDSLFGSKSI